MHGIRCQSNLGMEVELQNLALVEVGTKDPCALPIQVRIAVKDDIVLADALFTKICQRCGLEASSYKYFTLCRGEDYPVRKYRSSDKIHIPATDLCLEKWCLNSNSEKKLMKSDPKAVHLLFIQAKHDVASGKLITTSEEKIKLDECLDPEFLVEEQYVLMCQKLPDYQTILVQGCVVCEDVMLKSCAFARNDNVNIFVSKYGLKIVTENVEYISLSWYEIVKWEYNKKKSVLLYVVHPADEDYKSYLSLKSVQAEYLLAATFEGVRELLAEDKDAEPFLSSMVTKTPEGATQWENSLFSPKQALIFS
ncbi:uncharacterized protein LOC121382927 isoform X1 [Gigantopelta aegis]|uniref:uncharacterized protein LOC121382927 isoform X1 n=1 Tax=Gigantopelta aegis TaxID=1735272 RepID=UPI001B88C331|nr:uncharacterized protein LOC121382927 isoform X1 [Gigantopelta aegis]